jgi:hypothetical protein
MIRILALVAALICAAPVIAQPLPANLDKQNAIVIDTTQGRIVTPSASSNWRATAFTTTFRSTA